MLYYSTELFIGAGLASESAKYATIGKLEEHDKTSVYIRVHSF